MIGIVMTGIKDVMGLIQTSDGRKLILHKITLRSKGLKQLKHYNRESKEYFSGFVERFVDDLCSQISSDRNPVKTHHKFIREVGFPQLKLEEHEIWTLKSELSNTSDIRLMVCDITDTDFIKQTLYIFIGLFDGAERYYQRQTAPDVKEAIIDGHVAAISLSELMDRIIDEERDPSILRKYKFLNPYILEVGRKKICKGGKSILNSFEEGFKNALRGQHEDAELAKTPRFITYEKMERSYAGKYRAIMGTAASNMALNKGPIARMYYLGMGKAAEAGGCRNEIMDSRKDRKLKFPSWPALYAHEIGDIRKAFALTHEKGRLYLEEAKKIARKLPADLPIKPFIEELFYVFGHAIDFEYKRLLEENLFADFEKQLKILIQ